MTFISTRQAIVQKEGSARLRGWVYRERKLGGKVFIVLRDGEDVLQCVIAQDKVTPAEWEAAQRACIESSITIEGTLRPDGRAPGGVELQATKFGLIHQAERFPITKDQSEEWLLDQRHLWIRSRELTAVWRVKAAILRAAREYFDQHQYVEMTPPIITGSSCEGGSTQFEIDYFEEKAYLGQSTQLYLEALIYSTPKVWALTPSFRAEPSKTSRHLAEYWHLEAETAWQDFEGLIAFEQDLIAHLCKRVPELVPEELKRLGRNPADLRRLTLPYPRITYDEALEILKKDGIDVPWGKDLRTVEEEALMKHYDKPLWVVKYPKAIKAFYMKEDPTRPDVVLCCDVLAPEGYGEIVGSSERETDVNRLIQRLTEQGEKPEHYGWYLDLRRFGSVPHAGFGLGIERVVRWFCRLESIRDAIPFPRTIKRMMP
jgi:asparaginyl-tRNA synthetase